MLDFATLAAASPTVLYLSGVIFLFLRLEKANKAHAEKMEKLVERYHSALLEGISIFKNIESHLEEKHD